MKLSVLPAVLQDLVMLFCFNLPKADVLKGVDMILDIKSMGLPFFFFRDKVWSWEYARFLPNPLKVYMPIEYYGGRYKELFNEDAVYCFLIGLDFRMKNVRSFGNRRLWEARLLDSWRVMDALAAFYKMLMRSKTRVLRASTTYEAFYD